MKRSHELEDLFSDAALQPRIAFVGQLKQQVLQQSRSRRRSIARRILLTTGVSAFVLAGLLVFSLTQNLTQQQNNRLAHTILVRDLFAQATADELPKQQAYTFWDITQHTINGPMAQRCTGFDGPAAAPTRELFFKRDAVSAAYVHGGWEGAVPYMAYSEDADVLAFDTDSLHGEQDAQVRGILIGMTLTDAQGTALADNARVAAKTTGSYDIYGTRRFAPTDRKNYMAGCDTLFVHIKVDAVSGIFTEAAVYNQKMDDANLSFKLEQTVKTATGDFASVQPIFTAAGFDLTLAKQYIDQHSIAQILNQAAGYTFSYDKLLYGKPVLHEIRNEQGDITQYQYDFPKQPQAKMIVYTAVSASEGAHQFQDLRYRSGFAGWTVVDDDTQPTIQLRDYGQVTEQFFRANNGVTKYVMQATGSSDIPYFYLEAPVKLGVHRTYDPYVTNPDVVLPDTDDAMIGLQVFKPGTEPPKGL